MKRIILPILVMFFGCSYIFENNSLNIIDDNNDGYDDRDILFLKKLIENSQGYTLSPDPDFDPLEIGTQIWVEGRLRSLKHSGGAGGFYLYDTLPVEIKDVEFLNKIVFSDNYLTAIPEEIAELTNLTEILLNDNRFSGTVPEGLWENKPNLKNLSFHKNYFTTLPESVCDVYEDINHLILSHNSFCGIPECISDPGIQSCECYDFIEMEICLDSEANISCAKTLVNVIENCPLKQFWGDALFNELSNMEQEYCINWEGNCDSTLVIDEEIEFLPEISNGCFDCDGNPCDDKLPWIGDGICDEGYGNNFSCPEFNCDMSDCGFYIEEESSCYCQRDCFGQCIIQSTCFGGWDYYDCCIDDGTCEDYLNDGEIIDWLGDGYCDDGTWGYGFNCQEVDGFQFNCDDGDCGVWNDDTGQCGPAPGQVIRYHDDYKFNKKAEVK